MVTVGVLAVTAALILLVLHWSGRYGDRRRGSGTSLRRGAHAHTTSTGLPKQGFATLDEATRRAHSLTGRDGVSMSAYRCDTCGKWHLGHG